MQASLTVILAILCLILATFLQIQPPLLPAHHVPANIRKVLCPRLKNHSKGFHSILLLLYG